MQDPMGYLNSIYADDVTSTQRMQFVNELSESQLQELVYLVMAVAQRGLAAAAQVLYDQAELIGSTRFVKMEADRLSALNGLLVEHMAACHLRLRAFEEARKSTASGAPRPGNDDLSKH